MEMGPSIQHGDSTQMIGDIEVVCENDQSKEKEHKNMFGILPGFDSCNDYSTYAPMEDIRLSIQSKKIEHSFSVDDPLVVIIMMALNMVIPLLFMIILMKKR